MSMHLVGPYMTTTKYNSKKSNRKKTAKQLKAEAEHDKFLRKQGVHTEQLEAKAKRNAQGNRVGIHDIPDYKVNQPSVKLSNKIAGHGVAKESHTYSGERQLLGIATMHKSNMVPIFADKKEDAKDIASMRR
jgi:sortase (surface protein transpeptidase)|tara:strand:+ start:304 stop:699 length:396 start_codon:yes stop_codon:yes gene_type:complete